MWEDIGLIANIIDFYIHAHHFLTEVFEPIFVE
jgi:hypothetical protein